MTVLPQDVVAELETRIAELEQRLQASSAQNARLEHAIALSRDRQQASAEVLRTIARTPVDAMQSLQHIAETCGRLFGAPSVSIRLAENGEWTQDIGYGETSKRVRSAVPTATIRIGGPNLPGTVVAENRQIHIPDLDRIDPAMADWPGLPHARAAGTRTICGTPLRREDEAIGVLIVYRDKLLPFTPDELILQQSFADQAVIAIENARLFNEVQERTRELSEALTYQTGSATILKVIASSPTDVDPVLKAIVTSACELCEADDALVTLKEGDELVFQAQHGPIPVVWQRQPIDRGAAAGRAIIDRASIHVHDLLGPEGDEFPRAREFARKTNVRTVLCVPLLREGQSIGVIVLRRTEVRPFSQKHVALLQTFADQAVIALGNVRLFEEVQAKTRDLAESLQQQTATAEVLKVISRSAFDLQVVLNTLVESAARLCEADMAAITRKSGDVYFRAGSYGFPTEFADYARELPVRPDRRTITGRTLLSDKVVHVTDVLEDPDYFFEGQQLSGNPRSFLGVPLLREGCPVGALVVARRAVRPFTDRQIELVTSFADQAVIAIENARLLSELRKRTDDLSESLEQQTATSEVLRVISNSSGDLQPVFDAMLANATRICEARFGMMWLIEGTAARCVALHNAPPAFAELRRREPVIHPGPHTAMGRLLKTRQAVHVEDAMAERAYIEGDPVRRANADLAGARTIVAVPMLRENEVIGAIGIFHQEVRPFTEKQVQLVTSFANQAVIAIENARLLNELRQRTTELSRSLEDLRAAQDRLIQTEKLASLGQLTAGIAHEIKNPLNFVNNFAALSAELTDELNEALASSVLPDKTRAEVDELTGLLKDNLQKVVQHGKRADSIVKNMLLHSREGSGEHRPTDINSLVEESLNLAYHGARAEKPQFNVTIVRELDAEAGTAELFPQEISRVLLNLISNGFYAVAKRRAEDGGAGYQPVVIAATSDRGDHVEIRIRDNGTGIPPEVKEKMFNPFFTTKPAGEGTGLGLSMSHDIVVKQHAGTIEVETLSGEFTEFTIRLPRKSNFSDKSRG